MTNLLLLPAISFLVMMGGYILISKYQRHANLQKRLHFSQNTIKSAQPQKIESNTTKKTSFLSAISNKLKKRNKKIIDEFRIRFERCGWDPASAAILVPAYKLFSVIIFLMLFFILNNFSGEFASLDPSTKYIVLGILLFLGYRSFDYLTDFKMAQRRNAIVKDIPMAIDLLVVCVRGGLSFDKALDRIAQEVIHTNPELARELAITSAELSILPERKVAYQNLERRIDSYIVHNLTTSLIQAEEQGVAIGKTLMFLSHDTAKQKLMMIERKAAKLPSKLTVPVILLSLPAILIIILGPTIAAILESDLFN